MKRPEPKGWCPGALRPMMSGDGLIVRIRPRLGRLDAGQVQAMCAAARTYGSGIIELTNRANLQIRGVAPRCHAPLIEDLRACQLISGDAQYEARNNIIVSPLWQPGDDSHRIATALAARLDELPDLPAKFGFAIDAGDTPILSGAPADIRVERSTEGGLIVRADGAIQGALVEAETAADEIIALSNWFADSGGNTNRRMARHLQLTLAPDIENPATPMPATAPLAPGQSIAGPVYGAPFGRADASELGLLMSESGAGALRMTPWRRFILEGGELIENDHFITSATDPIQYVDACPGAPFCHSATVETLSLARQIAGIAISADRRVHVSGCAKGCAHPAPAAVTLTGCDGSFDLIRNGCAWDGPEVTGLTGEGVLTRLGEA